MTVRLTPAQARRAGIDVPSDKVRVRKTARGPYWTVCCGPDGCGMEFHTQASEDRHVTETKHTRYQLVTQEVT